MAAGSLRLDLVAYPAVGQGPSQRRGQRDVARVDVHHLGQDHHVGVGVVGLEVQHRHLGAEADPVARSLGVGELAQLAEPLMQLAQPGLDELLPLERGLVLGVLPQVTQLDRLGDGLGRRTLSSWLSWSISRLSFSRISRIMVLPDLEIESRPGGGSPPGGGRMG